MSRRQPQSGAADEARAMLRESWEKSEATGRGFIGAAVQGAMAVMSVDEEARRQALAAGEALLREGSLGHCHLWFNRDAIQASLDSDAWSEAERHARVLEDFTREEPLPWFDHHIAVARALAAAGRGNPDLVALRACREQAVALQDPSYEAALDAALARLAAA